MKKQLETQRHRDELALKRALLCVAAAGLLELFVFCIHRFYINYAVTVEGVTLAEFFSNGLSVLRIAGGGIALLGVLLVLLFLKKGRSIALPCIVTLLSLALMTCAHISLAFRVSGVQILFALVPVWGALGLLYYIYPRELFLSASMCCLGLMGVWFARIREGFSLEVALTLLGVLLLLAITFFLKKQDGQFPFGNGTFPFLPAGTVYTMALVSGGISVLLPVASALLGPVLAYYLLFGMAAWAFALLVYYTVKMM